MGMRPVAARAAERFHEADCPVVGRATTHYFSRGPVPQAEMRGIQQGPANLIITKGYTATMALSTLKHLLAAKYLRRGDGIISTPASRRKERLFGVTGAGRTRRVSTGKKRCRPVGDSKSLLLEPGHVPAAQRCYVDDESPEPRSNTCVRAFVRLSSWPSVRPMKMNAAE